MVEGRERACDEEDLRVGTDRRVYAEPILNVCKLDVESPLVCVSGVSGSNPRKRIAVILSSCTAVKLSFAKKAALTVAGITALALPITLGMMNAPAIRAQSSSSGNSRGVARPKFEVASIKPCSGADFTPGRKGGGARGKFLSWIKHSLRPGLNRPVVNRQGLRGCLISIWNTLSTKPCPTSATVLRLLVEPRPRNLRVHRFLPRCRNSWD
jgi:hypothetical protein